MSFECEIPMVVTLCGMERGRNVQRLRSWDWRILLLATFLRALQRLCFKPTLNVRFTWVMLWHSHWNRNADAMNFQYYNDIETIRMGIWSFSSLLLESLRTVWTRQFAFRSARDNDLHLLKQFKRTCSMFSLLYFVTILFVISLSRQVALVKLSDVKLVQDTKAGLITMAEWRPGLLCSCGCAVVFCAAFVGDCPDSMDSMFSLWILPRAWCWPAAVALDSQEGW